MNTNFNNDIDGALSLIVVNGKTYQLGKDATAEVGGIGKLYGGLGTNTDGSMTQAAIKTAIDNANSATSQVASDLSAYQTSNDAAVAANASAITAEETRATNAEQAINDKIGTVPANKTVAEMISDAATAAAGDNTALANRVSANESAISTLNAGSTTEGSVAYQIAQIVNENQNGSIDTLNEIAAWIVNDTTGAAKMASDISALSSNKADKVANATSGNFASLDANGNLIDSGHKHSDYKTKQEAVASAGFATDKTMATLSQNANGEISYTTQAIQEASASQHGLMTAAHFSKLSAISASVANDTLTIVTVAA